MKASKKKASAFHCFFVALLMYATGADSLLANTQYNGVNLAGADFGTGNLPGDFNSDYTYPTHAEVDYFVAKGMNIFRLPFMWERLQNDQNGPLNSEELARIRDFVSYAASKQTKVILDPHNGARYYGEIIGIDGDLGALPVAAFEDFWTKLANEFKDNSNVIFGLMNEPNEMPTELWRDDANTAISAIRATGATNLILVPGNAWTGAHSWNDDWYGTPNATVMQTIVDPGNNYVIEVHQYLDSDSSGTSDVCVSATIGSERLQIFTNWLRQHNQRGFLGEFAGGRNNTCLDGLDDMLTYLDDNSDVWLGWAYWAAGPWWGEDIFTLEPQEDGSDRPQMAVLLEHLSIGTGEHDSDSDGVNDDIDNCINTANANQRDSNNDGFGNVCDADLDDNGFVNFADLALFKSAFGSNDADFDGNGFVNFADLAMFKSMFGQPPGPAGANVSSAWFKPATSSSWHIQLQPQAGATQINQNVDVNIYDIDLFDNSAELIASLQNSGKKVICYFSAGSYEQWRNDAAQFNESDLGLPLDGWPGERWLDVRSANVRQIMQSRLDLAKQKGCDGVDPDNVDGYTNNTGLPLTTADQLDFNRFIADQAHNRGLAIGLKNDLDQIPQLVDWFDFSINEQCHQFNECDTLQPFISANKPVLNLEYNSIYVDDGNQHQRLCDDAEARGFYTLVLPLALDDVFRLSCNS